MLNFKRDSYYFWNLTTPVILAYILPFNIEGRVCGENLFCKNCKAAFENVE